jgi:hypothetical protein
LTLACCCIQPSATSETQQIPWRGNCILSNNKNSKETILSRLVVVVLILVLVPVFVLVLWPGPGLAQLPVPCLQLSVLPAQQEALPAVIAAMCFAGQAQEHRLSGIH